MLGAGLVLAYTSLRLPLVCPLRALTGIPCPLCGMTTGTVASLRGDLGAAMAANPFSLAVVPATLAGMLDRLRAWAKARPPRVWSSNARRAALAFGMTLAFFSWIFQLARFDVL